MFEKASISSVPDNILLEIFRFLPVKELCIVCRVCRSWRRIGNDNALWRHVDMTPYKLNLVRMWKVIRAHFSEVLLSLHLKGFHQAGSANLMKNSLSEAMMKDLHERCPNIRSVEIINNHFTNVQLKQFPQRLTSLKLTSCFIPPNWFEGAGTKGGIMEDLEVLDLSQSVKTTDSDVKHICNWKQLKVLRLNGCYRITSSGFEAIGQQLTSLRELEAREVGCSDLALHHIGRHLKQLERLVLAGQPGKASVITNTAIVNSVSTLTNLRHLDLNHSSLDDRALDSLCNLRQLTMLRISYTKVTQKGVDDFKSKQSSVGRLGTVLTVEAGHLAQAGANARGDTPQSQATLEY